MRGLVWLGLVLAQVGGLPQAPLPRDAPPPRTGTAVISGIVVAADTNLPLSRATVTLMAQTQTGGPARTVLSDASGRYTFDALPAGSYRVRATPGSFRGQYLGSTYGGKRVSDPGEAIALTDGQRVDDAHVSLPRGGAVQGRVVDETGEPVARVTVYSARALPGGGGFARTGVGSQTDDHGRFRIYALEPGEYIVAAESRMMMSGPQVQGPAETEGFAMTYYPSALGERDAGRIRVPAGGDAPEIHIQLVRTRTFRVTGVVLDSKGQQVMRPNAMLVRPTAGAGMSSTGVMFDQAGRFIIRDIVPGEYRLIVRPSFGGPMPPGGGPVQPPAPQEFAMVTLTVTADVEDLVVVTAPGATVTGQVVFEDGPPAALPTGMRIMTEPADRMTMMSGPSGGQVGQDLTFKIENAFGPIHLRPMGQPRGYAVKSITVGSTDVTYEPIELKASHSGRISVVLTNRVGTIEGLVTDDKGQPAPSGTTLILIPEDPAARRLRSGRVRVTAGLKDGRYSVTAVLPGRYYVLALPGDQFGLAGDPPPEFFEELIKLGTPVVVSDGETRTVELRVSKRQ